MCGIAGYLAGRDAAPLPLEPMLRALRHRGPDATGWRRLGASCLGATRLALVGGESGDQPHDQGRALLVLNGEIYNHDEWGGDCPSDTATLNRLLETEGTAALDRVRGPFALARLDEGGHRLILARDRWGQRPLYVAEQGGRFLFSSELRPLIVGGLVPETDEESLACLLSYQFLPPDRSLLRRVSKVPPGEVWVIRRIGAGFRIDRSRLRLPRVRPEVLGREFDVSLDLQRPRNHKSAVFLSGGLDSTVVTMGLMRQGGSPDSAIVGRFPDLPEADESSHAARVADLAGVPLHVESLSAEIWREAFEGAMGALEEPMAGPGSVSSFVLASRVAKAGTRIVFTGQGGDEIFGGYERLRILQDLLDGRHPLRDPAYARLVLAMKGAFGPEDRLAPYRCALRRGEAARRHLAERGASLLRHVNPLDTRLSATASPAEALHRAESFELDVLLPGLLQVDDRIIASFGMESRAPFLDPRVSAAALAVPLGARSPSHRPRRLFRDTFRRDLPGPIAARRRKLGFPVPLARWWRGPLREWVTDTLRSRAFRDHGYLRQGVLQALLRDDGQAGRSVFFWLALDAWHRRVASWAGESSRLRAGESVS